MFYLKAFILFSFLGFFWESFVYKIFDNNKHSGVLKGPYTLVYGVGFTLILYVYNTLSLPLNFVNCVLYYLIFCFCSTFCEFVIGYLIKFIFKKDMWDYSDHKFSFGKYICLEYFFLWGFLCSLFIFLSYNFWLSVINMISIGFVYFFMIIILIDFIFSYLKSRR